MTKSEIITKKVTEIYDEYEEVIRRKKQLEKKIKAIEELFLSDSAPKSTTILGKGGNALKYLPSATIGELTGLSGKKAYTKLVENDFKDRAFKEKNIRNLANKKGLQIRNSPIGEVTSRSIIADLIKDGILERLKRGLYRYKKQDQKEYEVLGTGYTSKDVV